MQGGGWNRKRKQSNKKEKIGGCSKCKNNFELSISPSVVLYV